MRTYDLVGERHNETTAWTLYERPDGEDRDVIAEHPGPLLPSEAPMWADSKIGHYTELDWHSDDGSVFSLHWRATDTDPWDED